MTSSGTVWTLAWTASERRAIGAALLPGPPGVGLAKYPKKEVLAIGPSKYPKNVISRQQQGLLRR